jgi:preprotein translocase subunit YajC
MTTRINTILTALTAIVAVFSMVSMTAAAQQQTPQTTKEIVKGQASVTTEQLHGTVEYVEGNTLLVRLADGGIREFNVPESRKFIIDGREVTVHDLKPGTRLSATVTTTTTPIKERTTTVGTGTVWWVKGTTVILTLPNGENKEYTVTDDYKFNIEGNKNATVFDLRKGMKVSAEKIVEEPMTEIVSNTTVTGQAPSR